jgi:hypothetical protein
LNKNAYPLFFSFPTAKKILEIIKIIKKLLKMKAVYNNFFCWK